MRRRFVYFYFLKHDFNQIKEVIPMHESYWEKQKLKNYMWGEFTDGTGGMVSFDAPTKEEAEELILDDPLIAANAIEEKWIKELIVE